MSGKGSRTKPPANPAAPLILGFIDITLRFDENPSFPGPQKHFVFPFQSERRIAPVGYLDVDGSSPVGHQVDFDEGTRRVDMSYLRMEVVATVTLMLDFQ